MNESSSTNTVLIVIVIILVVGFGVWWFARTPASAPVDDNGGNIEIDLGGDTGGDTGDTGAAPAPTY